MVLLEDTHWLFYSGNWFNQPAYAIGAARCEGPAGPCTKPFDRPFLETNAQGAGPGEGSLFVDADGALWMVYSPWAVDYETYTPRPVALARIGLDPIGPYLAAP
jgi:beta-xylosidase